MALTPYEKIKRWRERNPEKFKEVKRNNYWKNPEKRRATKRASLERTREKVQIRKRLYYEENKKQIRERARSKWAALTPEQRAEENQKRKDRHILQKVRKHREVVAILAAVYYFKLMLPPKPLQRPRMADAEPERVLPQAVSKGITRQAYLASGRLDSAPDETAVKSAVDKFLEEGGQIEKVVLKPRV